MAVRRTEAVELPAGVTGLNAGLAAALCEDVWEGEGGAEGERQV